MLTILCVSMLLILHTYLFYPLGIILLFPNSKFSHPKFNENDELPEVAILIAAYNEEKVIEEKIDSVFNTRYPLQKIKVYVGSDASTDRTDAIINNLQTKYPALHLVKFPGRVGKIGILNHLQSMVSEELLILTDANVIFTNATISELIQWFKEKKVGIVAANIIKESTDQQGIALQEKRYLSLENKIKAAESNAFCMVMGAEGGCYALRNNLFARVPHNFIVDDFFITFSVINSKKRVLFNPAAICIEDVASDTAGEFRRKVRISSGNFQNLFHFRKNLIRFWEPAFFMFWSHKVLRWFTPFLLILCFICTGVLAGTGKFFLVLFLLQFAGFLIPVFDHFFGIRNAPFKFISHFYLMNLALLEGFVKFSKGIKSSIWQPIKRNV